MSILKRMARPGRAFGKRIATAIAIALGALAGTGMAQAASVSLSGWGYENFGGGPNYWSTMADGSSTTYTYNWYPSVLSGGGDILNTKISFDISVTTAYGGDDDFLGFVLGFDAGGVNGTASTDFLLFDWKRMTQPSYPNTSLLGLAVSQVGDVASNSDYWNHTGNVDELARAATLGSTGWAVNKTYSFDVIYTASSVQVWVDGVLQFDLSGSFSSGTFGFYNNSQTGIVYSNLDIEALPALPAVPLPASLPLLLAGLGGLGLMRRRRG